MFRTNDTHGQQSFFDGLRWLPETLRQKLEDSWTDTFYHEDFCQISKELYSDDEASRPHTGQCIDGRGDSQERLGLE